MALLTSLAVGAGCQVGPSLSAPRGVTSPVGEARRPPRGVLQARSPSASPPGSLAWTHTMSLFLCPMVQACHKRSSYSSDQGRQGTTYRMSSKSSAATAGHTRGQADVCPFLAACLSESNGNVSWLIINDGACLMLLIDALNFWKFSFTLQGLRMFLRSWCTILVKALWHPYRWPYGFPF